MCYGALWPVKLFFVCFWHNCGVLKDSNFSFYKILIFWPFPRGSKPQTLVQIEIFDIRWYGALWPVKLLFFVSALIVECFRAQTFVLP